MAQQMIEIPMEEGEPLGATLSEKLVVTKVQSGTLAEGKLKMGDQVIQVNGTKAVNLNDFFRLLRFAPPCARLLIIRDDAKAQELEARFHIPEERAKLIHRRDGFQYFVAKIEWKAGGPKLGLGIRHYQNRVLVSRCDEGSLSAAQLAIGDHIVDVEGKPVTDKDVARDMLLKQIQQTGFATMIVERPESVEAKHWTQTALASSSQQPPSVIMNSDVRAICLEQMKKTPKAPKKSILVKEGQPRAGRQVQVVEQPTEHVIASDIADMTTLRRVKK